MAIRLYDSLTRDYRVLGQRESGAPPVSKEHPFTFYNCGPTVYGPAHIGNFRTFLVNDVLRRLLILEFGADRVRYVRNLTNVDDKTIRQAREEGRPLAEVTGRWIDKFHADCAALNCLPLDAEFEPTATGYINKQVAMISDLLRKGHAYIAGDGSVYFKVSSFPAYGALSRIKERELQPGSALLSKPQSADADEKEDGSDFALWKAWKPEDGPVKWPGPEDAAEGRPGWHIECSAMSRALLGETIDLHSGGVDLLFPHHENEIAQSEGCTGHTFSRHWYHSEHLLVDGKKMSKSLGNLYTLDDLTAKGFSPMAVRYALLSGHPRKQLNFTLDSLHAAEKAVKLLRALTNAVRLKAQADSTPISDFDELPARDDVWGDFDEAKSRLCDDLNIPSVTGATFSILNRKYVTSLVKPYFFKQNEAENDYLGLWKILFALGIKMTTGGKEDHFISVPGKIAVLADKRWKARKAKDYKTADSLRAELAAAGWSMRDGKDGYQLEPLKK